MSAEHIEINRDSVLRYRDNALNVGAFVASQMAYANDYFSHDREELENNVRLLSETEAALAAARRRAEELIEQHKAGRVQLSLPFMPE